MLEKEIASKVGVRELSSTEIREVAGGNTGCNVTLQLSDDVFVEKWINNDDV